MPHWASFWSSDPVRFPRLCSHPGCGSTMQGLAWPRRKPRARTGAIHEEPEEADTIDEPLHFTPRGRAAPPTSWPTCEDGPDEQPQTENGQACDSQADRQQDPVTISALFHFHLKFVPPLSILFLFNLQPAAGLTSPFMASPGIAVILSNYMQWSHYCMHNWHATSPMQRCWLQYYCEQLNDYMIAIQSYYILQRRKRNGVALHLPGDSEGAPATKRHRPPKLSSFLLITSQNQLSTTPGVPELAVETPSHLPDINSQ